MATNEEEVSRFSIRRGARFSETFQGTDISGDDEGWLTTLGQDPTDAPLGQGHGVDEAETPKAETEATVNGPAPTPGGPEPLPGHTEAMATLGERLAMLEEAVAGATAACAEARTVLLEGQAVLDRPSHTAGAAPGQGEEATPMSRIVAPLQRYRSLTMRQLLRLK